MMALRSLPAIMADSTDQTAHVIFMMLAVGIVASGLLARRLPLMRLLAWACTWALLLLGVFFVFRALEPQITKWQQSRRGGAVTGTPIPAAMTSLPSTEATGGLVRIPMSNDGHYWVEAVVNGQNIRFLIDSGASTTAISQQTASALPLSPDPLGGMVMVQTANGPISAQRSILPAMEIGSIHAIDLPVIVSPAFGTVNVLGMNFLGKLKSWRVEDGTMILEAG